MTSFAFLAVLLAGIPAMPHAQSAPAADKTLTLIGCVQRDETRTDRFTLSDKKTGTTYHLTGKNVKAFVWRNVRIVGGLVPTPNIAAQAGTIDPAKAALAYQGANPAGAGHVDLRELRVNTVRPLSGACSPKK